MIVWDALRTAYGLGLEIGVDGETLTVRGATTPCPQSVARLLKTHKIAIVVLLAEQKISHHDGYNSPHRRRYIVPPGCIAAGACHRLKPCAVFLNGASTCGTQSPHEEADDAA